MTDAAIFEAAFADFKLVKTRGQGQFIFEIPLEGSDAALKKLGGLPRPDRETWVAIAVLDPNAKAVERQEPPKERRIWDEITLPEQAGIRCQDYEFRRFLRGVKNASINDAQDAAEFVRGYCGIGSRAELSVSDKAARQWRKLDGEFRARTLTPMSAG